MAASAPLRTVENGPSACATPAESDITIVKVVSAQLYINSLDEIKRNRGKGPAGAGRPWPRCSPATR